jgi:hypothetical protein
MIHVHIAPFTCEYSVSVISSPATTKTNRCDEWNAVLGNGIHKTFIISTIFCPVIVRSVLAFLVSLCERVWKSSSRKDSDLFVTHLNWKATNLCSSDVSGKKNDRRWIIHQHSLLISHTFFIDAQWNWLIHCNFVYASANIIFMCV